MKIRSVKFNFIMNFILTASYIIFPLITFPYVSRVLLAAGNGKVAFATSVLTYFSMFASLGIPTYGIRACAKVREDHEKLSKTVQELLIINTITMCITYLAFLIATSVIPEFRAEKELLFINSIILVLNVFGVSWLYSALEQYAYITICSLIFKIISIVMMFAWVKNPDDYIKYGAITVFAAAGSYIMNFINLHKYVSLKKKGIYNFRQHIKPICVFFAMSAAISVYTNLDVVMLKFMKNDAEVGYYNAAIKVKTILVSLITSMGAVLLPRLSFYVQTKQKEAFRKMLVKAFNFVIVFAVPVTIFFMIFAEESILILAGNGFVNAVLPMFFLMPTVLFIGLSNVTGIQVLTPTNKENQVLISILFGAVLDFALNLVLIPTHGATGAAFATMMAEGIVLLVQVIYLRNMLNEMRKQLSTGKVGGAIIVSTIIILVIKGRIHAAPIAIIGIAGITFFSIYFLMLIWVKEKLTMNVLSGALEKIQNARKRG